MPCNAGVVWPGATRESSVAELPRPFGDETIGGNVAFSGIVSPLRDGSAI